MKAAASGCSTTSVYKNMAHAHGHVFQAQTPDGENGEKTAHAEGDPEKRDPDTLGWASLCARAPTRNDDASRLEKCDALSVAQEDRSSGGTDSSAAAVQPRFTIEGYQNVNLANNDINPSPETATNAAEVENLAARKRYARLEALADLAHQGLAAHWKTFFRDEIERARMVAAAVDMTAERWVQRQREALGVMWASWCGREWESTSTTKTGSNGGDSDSVTISMGGGVTAVAGEVCTTTETAPGEAAVAATAAITRSPVTRMSDRDDGSSRKVEGAAPGIAGGKGGMAAAESKAPTINSGSTGPFETGERQTPSLEGATQVDHNQGNSGSGSTVAEAGGGGGGIELSDDHDDGDSLCVVVVRDVRDYSSVGQQPTSADAEAPTADQLVVFVGRAMAFHLSTIRSSHMENFNEENRRRRCSSFSLPPQQSQQGQRCATHARTQYVGIIQQFADAHFETRTRPHIPHSHNRNVLGAHQNVFGTQIASESVSYLRIPCRTNPPADTYVHRFK